MPAAAYVRMPEHEGAGQRMLSSLTLRCRGFPRRCRLTHAGYRQLLRDALYGDVTSAVAEVAIALLIPDAPARIALEATVLTPDGWRSAPRTYVVCRGFLDGVLVSRTPDSA